VDPSPTIFFQISGALFCLPQWLHVQLPSGKLT
jgi:hypothetical protein